VYVLHGMSKEWSCCHHAAGVCLQKGGPLGTFGYIAPELLGLADGEFQNSADGACEAQDL
jgi:hypothetical protein